MTSAPVGDPLAGHLLATQNTALLFIGYQRAAGRVRSMDRALLVKNAVSSRRAGVRPARSRGRPAASTGTGNGRTR